MPSSTGLRAIVAALVFLAAVSLAPPARAECDVGKNDVGLAFVWAERDCRHNVHADMRLAAYKSSASSTWRVLLGAELGLLERIDETRVQVGPVLALGGAGMSTDWGTRFDEFFLSPRVRARMWMVDELLTFEAALGPTIHWNQAPFGDWAKRAGGYVEIGPTYHGVAGFFVGTGYIAPGGGLPGDWRTTVGLRMNFTFSAAAAALGGLLYACGKNRAGC